MPFATIQLVQNVLSLPWLLHNSLVRAKRHPSKNDHNSEFSGPGGGLNYWGFASSCIIWSARAGFLAIFLLIGGGLTIHYPLSVPSLRREKETHSQESTDKQKEITQTIPFNAWSRGKTMTYLTLHHADCANRTLALLRASQPLILIRPFLVSPSQATNENLNQSNYLISIPPQIFRSR